MLFAKNINMKNILLILLVVLVNSCTNAQEPWKSSQLMEPSALATRITENKAPLIVCIGPTAIIPNSVFIGMASEEDNLGKLRTFLKGVPKDKEIVIYCGCCPFEHCPNVRPAFRLLNSLGFKNHKLLNLSNNIRTDWINKGYPIKQL